ncbi:hypothetical protein [Bradyrhizobium sp. G127]|uniref:hypothetical protein n=1 Tax=Bradyrhizobium sp. G127 TaxID=2904800 RepID=UPI001F441A0D|nr:hypothetical protein [Bradyrhizobium sp. G127]MCF2524238.1 hypothetical protein [Bradyrhizobium sp. G127]
MSDFYFSAQVDDETTICIAPITERRVELSGEEIEDKSGYFLFETKGGAEPSEVHVLARLTSEEAALRLKSMLALK